MEVYLVPVGPERYELYCEVIPDVPQVTASSGWWRRVVDRFSAVLTAVEDEERGRHPGAPDAPGTPPGLGARIRRRALKWAAERITEQRLLWHLRQADRAAVAYPDDLDAGRALAHVRKMLARDLQRHRIWLVVAAAAFVASGVVMPIPGPNLLAYYFAFRLVGHFLSMRGAQKGLSRVVWDPQASHELTALRAASGLEVPARRRHVADIAARLGLRGLPRFYERTTAAAA